MFSKFLESLYDGIRDDDEDNRKSPTERHDSERNVDRSSTIPPEEEAQARGVKDDLTELTHTLTRNFRGVANFLAPLPETSSSDLSDHKYSQSRSSDPGSNQSCVASDTREAEIRARSWSSDTILDTMEENDVCSDSVEEEEETDEEEEEEEEMDAVAITDEVLAFARNIAMHPETWLDFPLDPEEDLDDLEMSDAQRSHALAIERLAPRLAALRIELCPCHMTVGYFWKVYFVLLHSRLSKHDAQLLSSPQVMEARALWMKELQSQNNSAKTGRGDTFLHEEIKPSTTSSYYHHAPPEFLSPRIYAFEPPSIIYRDFETVSENVQFIDKAVIVENPIQKMDENSGSLSATLKDDDDDDDDWPEEEDCGHKWTPMFTVNEDDVSFSDLEGDDDISSLALKSKSTSKGTDQKGT